MLLQKGSGLILGYPNVSIVFKLEAVILLCPALVLSHWGSGVQFEQFKKEKNQLEKVWKSISAIKHKECLGKFIFGLENRKVKKSKLFNKLTIIMKSITTTFSH